MQVIPKRRLVLSVAIKFSTSKVSLPGSTELSHFKYLTKQADVDTLISSY